MQIKTLFCFFLFSILGFGQNNSTNNTIDTLAEQIIAKAFENITKNASEKSLAAFQFKKYSKGIIQWQDKNTKVLIPSENNYIFEWLSLHQYQQQKIALETVLASNFPGFEKPYYPLFGKTIHSASIYEKEYVLLDKRFYGPLSKKGLKVYKFQYINKVSNVQKPYHIIKFLPKSDIAAAQLEGELHIDATSFAVQKATLNHVKNIESTIVHHFSYFEKEDLWFPTKTSLHIKPLNALGSYPLFGKNIAAGNMHFKEDENSEVTFTLISSLLDIQLEDVNSLKKKPIDILAVEEKNEDATSIFWDSYREKALNEDELTLAKDADSSIKYKNIETKIKKISDFNKGYYPIGFFDLDLKFLVKFNNYEGLRSGLGGVTNEKLSENFNVGGYLVRGFKDEAFKYQIAANFLVEKATNTILGIAYTKDVEEIGSNTPLLESRTFTLFEPRLLNITQFYKHKTWQTTLQHSISPNLNGILQLSKSTILQTIPYTFFNNDTSFTKYALSEAKIGVLWAPFGKYMQTPLGINEYEIGYPRISTQITQSFKDVLKSDFYFTKIDVKVDHLINHINEQVTEIVLEGNLGLGDIPLTHAYHAYPNSPNKETILDRFSVAGIRSFETMYFGEFFSTKLASVHIKHRFKPFIISSRFKPEFVLISRHAIGDFTHQQNHQNITFNTLEKGYSESGFEINKIIFGFGFSFAYRYGAYHLPTFEDNISAKFTFNFKL
ncbi:MAG: hypothetical protein CVU03_00065 [Bacteroidetes bacterium HGW-Bacteroidetes-2]|jgi:hypothetical protein|nr:MAG: hypothetical protein CVU03_00065 [Bacteroidetes bacterium HGW-Bacteroidetes-2]